MAEKIRYTRAIIFFVSAFAAFLISLDLFLFIKERNSLYEDFKNQTEKELSLISTFVKEPLLAHKFSMVEQFIVQWVEKKKDIVDLKAITPDGFVLIEFSRSGSANDTRTFHQSVRFMGRHLLDLRITKDFADVDKRAHAFLKNLILQSLLIIGVFGMILWFILKRLALRPLEEEIIKRKDAESSLQRAYDQLETKVIERTSELASEKERLAVTLRSIGDGVITTTIDGEIVLINKVAEELTGWTQEEASGKPLMEVFNIIDKRNNKPCEDPVARVIREGQIIGINNRTTALVARDGSENIIADSGAPIMDKNSEIVGVVLVFRNITEQLRMEQELIKVKKLESIGVLAGGIAHDFNNILSAILGNINLVLYDADLKDETKRLLSETEKASLRAKNLTQQLLTFAKGGEPVRETSSLADVIRDSANFVLHGDRVACRFDIPDDLWLVDIDKGQISQVIQNMVLNAGQAMSEEGGTVFVSCENVTSSGEHNYPLLPKGKYVKISIKDTGIGIPSDEISRVFDPYFSTKQEGSGLGLPITHSIVSKHGGYITVDSHPGSGSTFMVYLPASENQSEVREKERVAVEDKDVLHSKILVMDDEEMVRKVAGSMLKRLGHEVEFVNNGEEAVKSYLNSMKKGGKFDLVIMDLTVPGGMGGKEAVAEILKLDQDAKVIVSSGYSNDPVMADFREYGFCSVIVKPYHFKELAEVVSRNLA